MASQPENIRTESEFFQALKKRCLSTLFMERIEPSNESGFPDVHFVERNPPARCRREEGTIELKVANTKKPNLSALMRGTQKSALIDYHEAGGRNRYVLCYCKGAVYLWDTRMAVENLLGKTDKWLSSCDWEEEIGSPSVSGWLTTMIRIVGSNVVQKV